MKKLLMLMLVAIMAISMVSCSVANTNEEKNTSSEIKQEQEGNLSENREDEGEIAGENQDEKEKKPIPEGISLNTEYLDLLDKPRSMVEAKTGDKGTYNAEFMLTLYNNGFAANYDEKGLTMAMYVPLEKMIYNCPDTITVEQFRSLFDESKKDYNYMDEVEVVIGNYKGKAVSVQLWGTLKKTDCAFMNRTDYDMGN
ncbi:MAG: hypothetical protein IJC89_00350 [Clostridia bacterium]|nr:hypothetical protein [Clostridia bacterium]